VNPIAAVLVSHDELARSGAHRAQWIAEGAGAALVVLEADSFVVDALEPVFRVVGAYTPFVVVHLVGQFDDPGGGTRSDEDDPGARCVVRIGEIHTEIKERFPGHHDLRHWVVHMVGQQIDHSEKTFVQRLIDDCTPRVRGVVLAATSTVDAALLTNAEGAGFAADVALLLAVSDDLEHLLARERSACWAVGVSSAVYGRQRLARAVATFSAVRCLDESLAAPPRPGDPSFELGKGWVKRQALLEPDRIRNDLLAGPTGGTILSALRMGPIEWSEVPLESWADVLRSRQQLLVLHELPVARRRVEQNRVQWLARLHEEVWRADLDVLEERSRYESVLQFNQGIVRQLAEADETVDAEPVGPTDDDIRIDFDKLRDHARKLPFGPAAALRIFAFVLGVLVVVGAFLGDTDLVGLRLLEEPWARVAAVAVLVFAFIRYQARLIALIRIRDRLLRSLQQQLEVAVQHARAQATRQTLGELRRWVGGRPEWLDGHPPDIVPEASQTLSEWWAWVLERSRRIRDDLLAQAVERADPSGIESRYTLDVPTAADMATADIDRRVREGLQHRNAETPTPAVIAKALAIGLRAQGRPEDFRVLTDDHLGALYGGLLGPTIADELWPSLTDLLRDRPATTFAQVARVLTSDTTPALPPARPPSHILVVSEAGDLEPLIQGGGGGQPLGPDPIRIPFPVQHTYRVPLADVVMMLHLFEIPGFSARAPDPDPAVTP